MAIVPEFVDKKAALPAMLVLLRSVLLENEAVLTDIGADKDPK